MGIAMLHPIRESVIMTLDGTETIFAKERSGLDTQEWALE
jgi:hypothetical protein